MYHERENMISEMMAEQRVREDQEGARSTRRRGAQGEREHTNTRAGGDAGRRAGEREEGSRQHEFHES